MCIFLIKKFSLDLEVAQENKTARKQRGKRGCQRLPAFFEVGCEESRHFSSFGFIMADLVKFSLCFGPGKGKSLNFVHLFSMFRE